MPSFKERSYQKELLDRDDIPFGDIKRNMQELDLINRRLGGHAVTLQGVKMLCDQSSKKEIHVAEIGCGGGDNLRAIAKWGIKKEVDIRLTGIDINPNCISFAREQEANRGILFIHSDFRNINFDSKPDIIFSSLFCHHFTDGELVDMLIWKKQNCSRGFFINDLHRHPLAYHSIKTLTRLFSKSYLVKNDAPLSVRRGFVLADWTRLFQHANIQHFKCQWKWAFRWLITFYHDG